MKGWMQCPQCFGKGWLLVPSWAGTSGAQGCDKQPPEPKTAPDEEGDKPTGWVDPYQSGGKWEKISQ